MTFQPVVGNGCATGSYPPEAVSQDSSLGLTEGSDNRFESTGDGISKVFKTWPFLTTFKTVSTVFTF